MKNKRVAGGGKVRRSTRSARAKKGTRVLSATEAARSFSDLLDRVCYRGETFIIERSGEPVCEISQVKEPRFSGADFLTLLQSLPRPDPEYWRLVEDATRQTPNVPESPWEH